MPVPSVPAIEDQSIIAVSSVFSIPLRPAPKKTTGSAESDDELEGRETNPSKRGRDLSDIGGREVSEEEEV